LRVQTELLTKFWVFENEVTSQRRLEGAEALIAKPKNNDAIMTEFVGLRAKMYALRVDSKKDTKKVKSVKNNIVAKSITFSDYMRRLFDEIEMTREQSCIRSKLHDIRKKNRSKFLR